MRFVRRCLEQPNKWVIILRVSRLIFFSLSVLFFTLFATTHSAIKGSFLSLKFRHGFYLVAFCTYFPRYVKLVILTVLYISSDTLFFFLFQARFALRFESIFAASFCTKFCLCQRFFAHRTTLVFNFCHSGE